MSGRLSLGHGRLTKTLREENHIMRLILLMFVAILCGSVTAHAQFVDPPETHGDELLADYFQRQASELAQQTFADIETLDDWTSRRPEYHRQLLEMLGLDPMPERTPLDPKITGTVESDGVVVERLHFQSMPGLYVTANFYRPAKQDGPLPAILYVCGHANVKVDGVSLGNKTQYQHHGAWFARNGYVCLTIDTIQLGEIGGIHHGTYRENMWWWNNRGYTPAGVEAWNCVRSLDYLQSRSEVDADRIGVTGRSGGGAYSYWIAAIDDRVKAAVPVAGITSLKNHVVDGCVEGHCDCMYMLNKYRWDFPMVAALIAPRPLLIANTDKDRIFPLDGVVDVYTKTQKIYSLYDAKDKLGVYISEGPHQDSQELQLGAFRWLNRFVKNDQPLIEMAATPLFDRSQLKVFETLPGDERVTSIHDTFIPKVAEGDVPTDSLADTERLIGQLREQTFRGWPQEAEPLNVAVVPAGNSAVGDSAVGDKAVGDSAVNNRPLNDNTLSAQVIEFTSQSPYRLTMYLLERKGVDSKSLDVVVLDEEQWQRTAPMLAAFFPDQFPEVEPSQEPSQDPGKSLGKQWMEASGSSSIAFVVPRGVGPTAWTNDERERTHIRRRFMLLGQTQASMQIYDVRRAIEALRELPEHAQKKIHLVAQGNAAVLAVYASLFVDGVGSLELSNVPSHNQDAPDLLNISRVAELSDVIKIATMRTK